MIKTAIIEDNKTVREGLEVIIGLAPGCQCVAACGSAEEAIKILPGLKPDVVLMDIQLPGMTGVECTAQLRTLIPAAQIIIVTVYEDPDRIFQALRAGACGYLLKRSTSEQIIAAIGEVYAGGAPMSGEIARKVIAQFQETPSQSPEAASLSRREREVLKLVSLGLTNKEISSRLGVTVEAVRWHLKHIYVKLHVHSRTEAAIKFQRNM